MSTNKLSVTPKSLDNQNGLIITHFRKTTVTTGTPLLIKLTIKPWLLKIKEISSCSKIIKVFSPSGDKKRSQGRDGKKDGSRLFVVHTVSTKKNVEPERW